MLQPWLWSTEQCHSHWPFYFYHSHHRCNLGVGGCLLQPLHPIFFHQIVLFFWLLSLREANIKKIEARVWEKGVCVYVKDWFGSIQSSPLFQTWLLHKLKLLTQSWIYTPLPAILSAKLHLWLVSPFLSFPYMKLVFGSSVRNNHKKNK